VVLIDISHSVVDNTCLLGIKIMQIHTAVSHYYEQQCLGILLQIRASVVISIIADDYHYWEMLHHNTVNRGCILYTAELILPYVMLCKVALYFMQCWSWSKRTGGSDVEMFKILPRDWNL